MTQTLNEYGTTITAHKCQTCGDSFTICPAVPVERLNEWRNCLADGCASYDISRDVDMFFESLADAGLIEDEAGSDGHE